LQTFCAERKQDRNLPGDKLKFDMEQASHSEVYKLLIGLVAPRPIALITSMDRNG
jgi:hypothetical protein